MDQALFAKAVEITWKDKERFSNIRLRMGTFHTICNALSILGKRSGDGGLKDICVEAELVAEGSIMAANTTSELPESTSISTKP